MSAVAAIRYLLANSAPLTAQVAADKIKGGVIPINTELPAIGVSEISSTERIAIAIDGAEQLATARVQVTVMAKTYPAKKAILELVRLACQNTRGTVNGIAVDSILPDGAGPDFDDEATSIFMQSRDFLVKFLT